MSGAPDKDKIMPSGITEANNITVYRAGSNAPSTAVSRIRGATPAPVFTAAAPSSTVTWSDNGAGGSFELSGANDSVAAYTPKNKSQAIVITATDSGGSVNRNLTVWGTVPLQPQAGAEFKLDVETKVKRAKDRTRYSREEGLPEVGWVFAWANREDDAFGELRQFWADHRKVVQFYMVDVEGNMLNKVWFASEFKAQYVGTNRKAMTASFEGQFENVAYV